MKYVIVLGDGMADEPIEALAAGRRWNTQRRRLWISWQKTQR